MTTDQQTIEAMEDLRAVSTTAYYMVLDNFPEYEDHILVNGWFDTEAMGVSEHWPFRLAEAITTTARLLD